jgi:peroxiredoxin
MNRIILSIIFFFASSLTFAQSTSMTLKGECPASFNGQKLYLERYISSEKEQIDSTVVSNGKFQFTLKGWEPCECSLIRQMGKKSSSTVLLYLDYCNTYIKLTGETYNAFNTDFMKCTVTGNPTDAIVRDINEDVIVRKVDPESKEFMEKLKKVAARHDLASAFVMWKYCSYYFHLGISGEMKESLDHLSPDIMKLDLGQSLLSIYKQNAGTASGALAPDFTLNTPDGKPVTLSQFIQGKKVVLIDFWASWCAPCRKEGENIKAIFKDCHDKGFDVIGVSLDSKLESWKAAIAKDGITWTQVSDLKAWTSPICKQYDFNGIPTLILLDGQGHIVAKNLRGNDLRNKVVEMITK